MLKVKDDEERKWGALAREIRNLKAKRTR